MNYKLLLALLILTVSTQLLFAQNSLQEILQMQSLPKSYPVNRTTTPIQIDGIAKEDTWKHAAWTDTFVDIRGDKFPKPNQDTRMKMLWDDTHLYVYAELQEKHISGTLQQRDTIIYHDNDFELFIKNQKSEPYYYEIEVNAKNTIFDLMMSQPYRFGGHALIHWDVQHIKSAVHIEGTLNNPTDTDRYWTVEMAIPFQSLTRFGASNPPKINTHWQMNFSRVQWQYHIENNRYVKKKDARQKNIEEDNWVWSPIGVVNMHYPERWGYIQFVENKQHATLPPSYNLEKVAWNILYLQKLNKQKTKKYQTQLPQLEGYRQLLEKSLGAYKYSIEWNKDQSFFRIILLDNKHNLTFILDSNGHYTTNYE